MDSLRWILLGLGVLVIVGVYLWTRWQSARDDRQYGAMLAGDLDADPVIASDSDKHATSVESSFESVDDELSVLGKAISEEISADPGTESFDPEPSLDIKSESNQPLTQDPGLPGSDDELLVLYLVANRGAPFQGKALRDSFGKAGLEFGKMDIYHRKSSSGAPVFSVANLVEPGTFEQRTMDSSETRGLCLFMRLPGPVPPVKAFDDFNATAGQLVDQLGGELRDESRSLLTQQTIDRTRETLVESERKQQLVS